MIKPYRFNVFNIAALLFVVLTIFSCATYSGIHSSNTNNHVVLSDRNQFEEGFELAWIAGPENKGNFQVSPVFIQDKLYVFYPGEGIKGFGPSGQILCDFKYSLSRSFREIGTINNLIIIPSAGEVLFFDTEKCELSKSYGNNGKIKIRSFSLLAPAIDLRKKIIISPALSGAVEFYDFHGKFLGEVGLNGELVKPRIWSGFNYDSDLGLAYIVTSNSGFLKPYEIEENDVDYSNSIIAIDVNSKNVKWRKQEFSPEYLDLDFVAKPMVIPCDVPEVKKCIVALSKSGSIFFLNALTGDFIFNENIVTEKRLRPLRPHPLGSIKYDPVVEWVEFNTDEVDRLKRATRYASFLEDDFTTVANDHVLFGLHGGPEWFGGSYDASSKLLVVPTNRMPWILRTEYYPKRVTGLSKFFTGYKDFQNECASCHGKDMEGFYTDEAGGDLGTEIVYIPSLLGAKRKFNIDQYTCDSHLAVHFDVKICPDSLNRIANYLTYVDLFLVWDSVLGFNEGFMERRFWQPLVTSQGFPASKTPWGNVTAVDLSTGAHVWSVPFGETELGNTGDWNMGGLTTTSTGYTIASGTRDAKAKILRTSTGELISEIQLSAPASSPPTPFFYDGCTYLAFNASGGKFFNFKRKGKGVEVYVNKSCRN